MISEKIKIVSDVLGYPKRQSSEHLYTCPYCNHHKKKFSVNFDRNVFKCWVCDARGRNIRRVIRRFGSFTQLKEWDKLSGIVDHSRLEFDLFAEEEEQQEQIISLPKEFKTLTGKPNVVDKRALCYLQKRQIEPCDLAMYKIGYCSEGEYEGRIIIPSFNIDGYVNYFIARSFDGHWMRYKNPDASRDIIFNELLIDWDSDVILVEGVFDAIFAGNAVALLGSTLREESKLFQHIIRNDSSVFIALDPDAEDKAMKIARTLLKYDVEVWKIDLPKGEDVSSIGREAFAELKKSAVLMRDNQDWILKRKLMSL
jgi:DNA primase